MSFGRSNKRRKKLDEIAAIAEITGSLRESGAGDVPDLTDSILSKVNERRAFTDRGVRRRVWATRAMIGGSVAFVALGIALAHRAMPGELELTPRPEPLSAVIMGVSSEATTQFQKIQTSIAEAPAPRFETIVAQVSKHCSAPCEDRDRGGSPCFVGPVRPCRSATMIAEAGAIEVATPVIDPREVLGRAKLADMPRNRLAVEPQAGIWSLSAAAKPATKVDTSVGTGLGGVLGGLSPAESILP